MLVFLTASACAQSPSPGKNTVLVRGQKLDVYLYPAGPPHLNRKILFVPGDGGWRGYAVRLAEQMQSWGYDVYGLDTRTYLESFTSGKTHLKETDVANDFLKIARWMKGGSLERITLVGWSEGADLCLLAAADDESKGTYTGLATFGLSKEGILGWRWSDFTSYITKTDPDEPKFSTTPYVPKVAPLPLLILQSSHDEYVPVDEAKRLFASAREPKRFVLIEARNHRFDGNHDDFFRSLRDGLEWFSKIAPDTPAKRTK
jgi:alpha-beta hydrolase superfamily lysophospholipase